MPGLIYIPPSDMVLFVFRRHIHVGVQGHCFEMINKGFRGCELLLEYSFTRVLDDLVEVIKGLYFDVWRSV
jgi:hypothetical protein